MALDTVARRPNVETHRSGAIRAAQSHPPRMWGGPLSARRWRPCPLPHRYSHRARRRDPATRGRCVCLRTPRALIPTRRGLPRVARPRPAGRRRRAVLRRSLAGGSVPIARLVALGLDRLGTRWPVAAGRRSTALRPSLAGGSSLGAAGERPRQGCLSPGRSWRCGTDAYGLDRFPDDRTRSADREPVQIQDRRAICSRMTVYGHSEIALGNMPRCCDVRGRPPSSAGGSICVGGPLPEERLASALLARGSSSSGRRAV